MVLGCLVCQMGLGFGYVYGPLIKDIVAELELTRALFSSARAPTLVAIALASPLVGVMTGRAGARGVLTASVLLLGLVFVGLSRMQSLWHLYALNVGLGLVIAGLGDIAVGGVVTRWIARGRGLALGLVYTGSNLGGMLLTPLATWLAVRGSWREALLVIGVGGAALLLPFAAWAVREPRAGEAAEPDRAETGATPAPAPREGDLTLAEALRTRTFWLLAAGLVSFFFYFLAVIEHLIPFLTDEGISREAAAAHFSFALGMGIASKLGFGWIADRVPHRSALLLDYGLLAASSLLLLLAPSPVFLPLFLVSYGVATAARDVVYPLVIADCFGVRFLPQIYGALLLALLPGGVLGPIFAGASFDRFGSYRPAFAVFAVLNLLVLPALAGVRRETKPAAGGAAI